MAFDPIFLTDADVDIQAYATSPRYDSHGPRIDKDNSQMKAHWKRGLDVDTCVLVIAPRKVNPVTGAANPDTINGSPWIEAALAGVFAGADIQIDRAYFATWGAYEPVKTPTGIVTIFAGRVAEVDVTDTLVILTVNDYRDLFSMMLPPSVFAAQCRHTLFDDGCRLLEANFRITGSIIAGSTKAALLTTAVVPGGSGTFALGKIRMTSGLNSGFSRTISSWTAPNVIGLINPFPYPPQIGDTFDVFPGCNKTREQCAAFVNSDNYGGFDQIPTAASAI